MNGSADEVEAKLLASDASTLAQIRQLASIAGFACREVAQQRLRTTYFDDADRSLGRHGIALRVRQEGDRWEVTLKGSGRVEGDVHRRPELNLPLSGAPGTPPALPAPIAEVLGPLVNIEQLEPLVVTEIERTTTELRDADRVIAWLALDRVRNSAPAMPAQPAYFEVEIELVDGTVDELERVAGNLKSTYALRPTAQSKLSRAIADLDRIARRS